MENKEQFLEIVSNYCDKSVGELTEDMRLFLSRSVAVTSNT